MSRPLLPYTSDSSTPNIPHAPPPYSIQIAGLNIINIGGQEELEYGGEVVAPLPSLLEASSGDRPHDRRGLLTRDRLSRGPEFGVTLGAAPALDGSHEVFGRLLQVRACHSKAWDHGSATAPPTVFLRYVESSR